jgi:hypothetical protein
MKNDRGGNPTAVVFVVGTFRKCLGRAPVLGHLRNEPLLRIGAALFLTKAEGRQRLKAHGPREHDDEREWDPPKTASAIVAA